MNILGLSCYYHDSAACLISDEKVYALQEERLTRIKHTPELPVNAVKYCLESANISIDEVDYVVFYEKPYLKFYRALKSFIKSWPSSYKTFMRTTPRFLGERLILPVQLEKQLGYKNKVFYLKHHLSHASSAFLVSPYKKAIIITSDGIGEQASITTGYGEGNKITIEKELHHPNSLGLLYSALTTYAGFRANGGEGKVMALADYGEPEYLDEMKKIVKIFDDGSFKIDTKYFDFDSGNIMFTNKFVKKFGPSCRGSEFLEKRHFNMASTLQKITEEILLKITTHTSEKYNIKNMCAAGGVFLNCVTNAKIIKQTPIENLFVQPASGDAGGALGAAFYIYNCFHNKKRFFTMNSAKLGPEYSDKYVKSMLESKNIKYTYFENEKKMLQKVISYLLENKIVGWVQGKMEFGPRALGSRTIIANPCFPEMKEHLNEKVKHREWFRPYGISILENELNNYFDTDYKNQFMLFTGDALEKTKEKIPAAIHVDGSCRYQTVSENDGIYYRLIKQFY
ncbi:MAG: carbamoyltransferase family protein, partial [Candidatus Muiribacteriota bacterium]